MHTAVEHFYDRGGFSALNYFVSKASIVLLD